MEKTKRQKLMSAVVMCTGGAVIAVFAVPIVILALPVWAILKFMDKLIKLIDKT